MQRQIDWKEIFMKQSVGCMILGVILATDDTIGFLTVQNMLSLSNACLIVS